MWALELQVPGLKPRLCHLTGVQPPTFTGPPRASVSSSVEWVLASWGLEEDSVKLHARPPSQSEHRVSAGCGLPSELERSTVPAVLALEQGSGSSQGLKSIGTHPGHTAQGLPCGPVVKNLPSNVAGRRFDP